MRVKLLKFRKERCLRQEDVAQQIGISRAYYGRIETGERTPSFRVAVKIKDFFRYYQDDLFFEEKCDKVAK